MRRECSEHGLYGPLGIVVSCPRCYERLQKDAERYRWMRAHTHKLGYLGANSLTKWLGPDNFDERIDEMKKLQDSATPVTNSSTGE
jgi:hypothetical protein